MASTTTTTGGNPAPPASLSTSSNHHRHKEPLETNDRHQLRPISLQTLRLRTRHPPQSEDDIHKCIKYDVWSSTSNGNRKLDAAFHDAEAKTIETGTKCPIFLFFSVNGSGQFVGVSEMLGPVDFNKDMDFWQLDKWNGFFPVKWHVIKDVPSSQLRHITLENNDNKPVTYTRDTQEVGLKQGIEMLNNFKSYSAKTSMLDDFNFYENREKSLKTKRSGKQAPSPTEIYNNHDFAEEVVSLQRELSTKDQVHTVRPCKQKATAVPSSALSPSTSGS